MFKSIIIFLNEKLCKLFGHRWRYINYSNHIKVNGDKYDFKAARKCVRCLDQGYFYTQWVVENKSVLDYENKYFSTSVIDINDVKYT